MESRKFNDKKYVSITVYKIFLINSLQNQSFLSRVPCHLNMDWEGARGNAKHFLLDYYFPCRSKGNSKFAFPKKVGNQLNQTHILKKLAAVLFFFELDKMSTSRTISTFDKFLLTSQFQSHFFFIIHYNFD